MMSFGSHVLGTLTFNRSTLSEIADSEELTKRGWILFIGSCIIAGGIISVYYLLDSRITLIMLVSNLLTPILFCFFYGFDLIWSVVVLRKGYKWKSITTRKGIKKGLGDPDLKRAIRIMGYSSLVLLFSAVFFLTGIEYYTSGFSIAFIGISTNLSLQFFFPFLMFLNPLVHPIVFFLIWMTIIFVYGYNIGIEEEEKGKTLKGVLLGFIIFNLFWTVVIILVILSSILDSH